MAKKSQISVEFIIVFSAALIIFLIMFAIVEKKNSELYSARTTLYARQEADKLASSINTIFLAGEGAKKTVTLPEKLVNDESYSVNIYPSSRFIEITWIVLGENKQYTNTLITSNITGSLNSLSNRTIIISNVAGGIVIG